MCYTKLVVTPGVKSVKTGEPQVLGCCKLALAAGRKRERQESGAERMGLPLKEEEDQLRSLPGSSLRKI